MSILTQIFDSSKDAIVSINVPNGNLQALSSGSGWIHSIKKGRIIVVTCAHLLLENKGLVSPVKKIGPITCSVSNAIAKGSTISENIAVSLGILGMDVSADIVVCFSYLPHEITKENPFGFKFSSKNKKLIYRDSTSVLFGELISIISNTYGTGLSMSDGTCTDNDVVYGVKNPLYTNFTSQFISSVSTAAGSSGSAVLTYDPIDKMGKVVGMVAWEKKTSGQYVGGPSSKTLKTSVNKILELNPICEITTPYKFVDFDGKTGSGFLGVSAYAPIDDLEAQYLVKKYSNFAALPDTNKLQGVRLTFFTNEILYPIVIPKSRVQNAKNLVTGKRTGLKIDDVVLTINGLDVGYYDTFEKFNFDSYYNINIKVVVEIIRPSTGKRMQFEITPDEYPLKFNYVSIDKTISLIGINDIIEFTKVDGGYVYGDSSNNPYWVNNIEFNPPVESLVTDKYSTRGQIKVSNFTLTNKPVFELVNSKPGSIETVLVSGQVDDNGILILDSGDNNYTQYNRTTLREKGGSKILYTLVTGPTNSFLQFNQLRFTPIE